jgi:uncharacterized protein DUF6264
VTSTPPSPPNGPNEGQRADPRPRPQYGEYAPAGWVPPVQLPEPELDLARLPPPTGPRSAGLPPATPELARDRVLTLVLLGLGFIGAMVGLIMGLTLRANLLLALAQYGIDPGTPPAWLDAAGLALAASHVLLYLAAAALSVSLLRRGRPASWAPLAAGIFAAIIFWSVMTAALDQYSGQLPG